jgi:hypothetical protein
MKKFFAILAAVCLFGAMNVFADGVNTSGNEWTSSGNNASFTGNLLCVPTFTFNNGTLELGNFFNQAGTYSFNSSGNIYMKADMTGPAEPANGGVATYSIDYTFGNGTSGNMYTTPHAFTFPSEFPEDNNSGLYLTGDWEWAGGPNGSTPITCDGDFWVKFTPNSITIPSNVTATTLNFKITVDVTVTL